MCVPVTELLTFHRWFLIQKQTMDSLFHFQNVHGCPKQKANYSGAKQLAKGADAFNVLLHDLFHIELSLLTSISP